MEHLAEHSAAVAPHIDRLVIAVHRRPRVTHATELSAWRTGTGLTSPGLLINLRPFIVDGAENRGLLDRLHRYEPSATTEQAVRAAVECGVIDDEVTATPHGFGLAARLTEIQRTTMNELWADHLDEVSALIEPLTAVVDDLPERYPGDPFELTRAFVALDRPKPPGPFLVHHLLTVLRYLRADAHSEVLAEAELTPGEAARLDDAWRTLEGTRHPQPLEELVLRGLVTAEGELTDDGRNYRVAIERETDSVAGTAWATLDDDGRALVLECLARLPDHAPGS